MEAFVFFFFFQAEDGIRDLYVTGVQTCALPISSAPPVPISWTSILCSSPAWPPRRVNDRPGRSRLPAAPLTAARGYLGPAGLRRPRHRRARLVSLAAATDDGSHWRRRGRT